MELEHQFKNNKNVLLNYKLSKVNLSSILKFCEFHLSDSSASCLISLDLNIKTGVWNPLFQKKIYKKEWFNSDKIIFLNKKNINSFLKKKIQLLLVELPKNDWYFRF